MTVQVEASPSGYLVTKGSSHIRFTESEAAELTALLGGLLVMPRTTSPAKARLLRYSTSTQ